MQMFFWYHYFTRVRAITPAYSKKAMITQADKDLQKRLRDLEEENKI